MKREELDAIHKRAEAATPGPWHANAYGIISGEECVIWPTSKGTIEAFDNNVLFILKARQDVPALLAEVERLRTLAHKLNEDLRQAGETIVYEYSGKISEDIAKNEKYYVTIEREIDGGGSE